MAETNPVYEQALCYTAADLRRMTAGLVCAEGVTDGGSSLVITTAGAGLTVNISAGGAFVEGDDDPGQGFYYVYNDDVAQLTMSTADPTNPRIDTIIAHVYDSQYSGSDDSWALEVVAGTPTPGAILDTLGGVGAVPDNALVLGYVEVLPASGGPISLIRNQRNEYVQCGRNAYAVMEGGPKSIPDNDWTVVDTMAGVISPDQFDEVYFTAPSGGTIGVVETGIYDIQLVGGFPNTSTAGTRRGVGFGIGVSDPTGEHRSTLTSTSADLTEFNASVTAYGVLLNAGQTVSLMVFQDNAGGTATNSSSNCRLVVRKVG